MADEQLLLQILFNQDVYTANHLIEAAVQRSKMRLLVFRNSIFKIARPDLLEGIFQQDLQRIVHTAIGIEKSRQNNKPDDDDKNEQNRQTNAYCNLIRIIDIEPEQSGFQKA
ncbi:hypothetical protein D3C73_1261020 [compost metagenome]